MRPASHPLPLPCPHPACLFPAPRNRRPQQLWLRRHTAYRPNSVCLNPCTTRFAAEPNGINPAWLEVDRIIGERPAPPVSLIRKQSTCFVREKWLQASPWKPGAQPFGPGQTMQTNKSRSRPARPSPKKERKIYARDTNSRNEKALFFVLPGLAPRHVGSARVWPAGAPASPAARLGQPAAGVPRQVEGLGLRRVHVSPWAGPAKMFY